jgi:predicted Kef-type K+ transport protein
METLATLFAAINYRDPIWIAVAYLFGFIVWQMGLPPLVGFLIAGFSLSMLGASGGEFLNEMADIGVTLLLFTIGLKLHVKQLLRPEVWGVATAHMVAITLGISAVLILLAGMGLPLLKDLDPVAALILGFALSFSSTVFAVKVFEDKGGMGSQYGRIAIGVLIVQDIAAVIFLAASTAKLPSPWAAAMIISLIIAKPLLIWLLKRAGHGELLILYGLVLAMGGSALFELVSLKGDLGALFFGILVAQHPKAGELAKALLSLKELFLVGFFLSIGIAVTPTTDTLIMASLLMLLIPLKIILFHILFVKFRLRTRTATFASLSLANFSEFGLIVTAIAYSNQWLPQEWLAIVALAVVFSFILASPLNVYSNAICQRFCRRLTKLEHSQRLQEDELLELGKARVLVCGMGRVGSGAFAHLHTLYENGDIIGIDFNEDKVKRYRDSEYTVYQGDASNLDFWNRVDLTGNRLEMILLCIPNHEANMASTRVIHEWGFKGHVAAIAHYPDEEEALLKAGVNSTFNLYAEVGTGFARDALQKVSYLEGDEKTAAA